VPRIKWRYFWAGLWLAFTLSLAAWWLIFGLRQIAKFRELNQERSAELLVQQRMLLGEGSILLFVLVLGGAALIYVLYLEQRRRESLQQFLSGFTHELKNSLSSLRLQSEILIEEEPTSPRLMRLLREVVRLEIQLENALLLARFDTNNLHLETIYLKDIIHRLAPLWPDLKVISEIDTSFIGDRRAVESIFKNFLQNSFHHGEATEVKVIPVLNKNMLDIKVCDNGIGFRGRQKNLGQAFYRHNGQSGSGLGLYLSKRLMKQMNGDLFFIQNDSPGFCVEIKFPVHP
jgi:signal transduction histidine kinase